MSRTGGTVHEPDGVVHLADEATSLLIDPATPAVLYWGPPLHGDDVAAARLLVPEPLPLLREHSRGFPGLPSVRGHRAGGDWSPLFRVVSATTDERSCRLACEDPEARLGLDILIRLASPGIVELSLALRNDGDTDYVVDDVTAWLPIPDRAEQCLDFSGRWLGERQPSLAPITPGTRVREGVEGRPGHDSPIMLLALGPECGFSSGEVWAAGVSWPGGGRHAVERLATGGTWIGGGESLHPGEVILATGQAYAAPPAVFAHSSSGIDGLSRVMHRWLRRHTRPRPLTLNVWEAVYFDHGAARLDALARTAAEVGVERFVLDDGWFLGRRHDRAGLGDWIVDPVVYPQGLRPLADLVTGLGMEFGLWIEPEMVSPDSQTCRAHPDWVLRLPSRLPAEHRHQQVLDLSNPDAFAHVLSAVRALLDEYPISYLKWDHNRPLVDAGDRSGRAAGRRQSLAYLRLLAGVRESHPDVEIEGCASGGGRVDLASAHIVDRFWPSDDNDAIDRRAIQAWTSIAIPLSMIGTHVGPSPAHSTGRSLGLPIRAVTALLGHAGIEWDITTATAGDRESLRSWAEYYRTWRDVIHGGDVLRGGSLRDAVDHGGPTLTGVVARDRSRAIYAYTQTATLGAAAPERITLPGLDPQRAYRVRIAHPAGRPVITEARDPDWAAGVTTSGAALASLGVRPPRMYPDSSLVIEADAG